MNYILDTCAFIWLCRKNASLSSRARDIINDPVNVLHLSDVSVWEIVLKHSAGRLDLPDSPRLWIPSRSAHFRLVRLPIKDSALYRSGELPRVHPDPYDRLLAAQTIEEGMTILSPDTPISDLGAPRVW